MEKIIGLVFESFYFCGGGSGRVARIFIEYFWWIGVVWEGDLRREYLEFVFLRVNRGEVCLLFFFVIALWEVKGMSNRLGRGLF